MHGENSKIKVAGWKNKSKAPTQSQNIIDSWAARGLLPSVYTNIYIPIWKWVGDQDGAQGCRGGLGQIHGRGHENLMIKRNVFVTSRIYQSLIRGGSEFGWMGMV